MIKGETVTVLRPHTTGHDPYGTPMVEWDKEHVDNVLLNPQTGTTVDDSTTPDALETTLVMYFPRVYAKTLRGCDIRARDRIWHVTGDPLPIDGGISPTRWNREVLVTRDDGG
ncbi:hypothetical protein [Bifidobacterium gallicum]|uniref:Phage protein n=1 Tax=Bifidobacterium gallicum DSM 20093 = LMG 11596 TaxID=561180 RepID=D1NSL6_9BIFI|nr:hypothetical protein [Bifidobacterium gallicum]EFA23668.1 hypothetical protein BIFGAL_02774 [Bifidobacterium gallicum DSM 20093 = LMG 11596]KFI58726.1 phage protein [Bifidobacterium gallicum DSM 20093 = LMG 11596]